MVEFSPATREARVRFPANATFVSFFIVFSFDRVYFVGSTGKVKRLSIFYELIRIYKHFNFLDRSATLFVCDFFG